VCEACDQVLSKAHLSTADSCAELCSALGRGLLKWRIFCSSLYRCVNDNVAHMMALKTKCWRVLVMLNLQFTSTCVTQMQPAALCLT
jgi:hypothetical protein